jgi:hypothetical protein
MLSIKSILRTKIIQREALIKNNFSGIRQFLKF